MEHDVVILTWMPADIIFSGEIIIDSRQIHEIKEISQIMNEQQNIHVNEQQIGIDTHLRIIIDYG